MSLWSDFLTNDGRVVHKWRHFFPAYEQHFAPFVNRPVVFIEIGCGSGGSMRMWKRFLGPHAQIVGLDINPRSKAYEEEQVAVRIGDQADTDFLAAVVDEFGAPDVILDDGSHVMADVVASFEYLYPRMAKNGVYLVEDLHTAYWERYGGGVGREGTFIELCKSLLDELNAEQASLRVQPGGAALVPTDFTRSTMSMHFYPGIAVFERGRMLPQSAPKVGNRGGARARQRDKDQVER